MIIGLALSTLAGCGSSSTSPATPAGSSGGSSFPSGSLSLTASPIAQGATKWITALGHLNPPQHTLPTDHIYFYFANPNAGDSPVALRTPFFAPGNGTVTFVIGGAPLQVRSKWSTTSTT